VPLRYPVASLSLRNPGDAEVKRSGGSLLIEEGGLCLIGTGA
jgi:hypothetical protein